MTGYFRELRQGAWDGWNRFWFSPSDPATLGLLRILAGAMLFYTHLVWTLGLEDFFGNSHPWLTREAISALPGHATTKWSYFYLIDSPAMLWCVHIAALIVFALLTIGLWSRVMSILAFIASVSYIHRASLAQFGLDDTNVMLAMYLMVGPSGAAYSVDRWLKRRRKHRELAIETSIGANLAVRLIQVHMCVVYLFSGIGKLVGDPWWDGTAIWGAVANLEYQSVDMTWLGRHPWIMAILTHVTVFWETFYCALIWPRLARPIMLAIAVALHLSIGAFLGMWTFGLAMLIGNAAFISPWVVRRVIEGKSHASSGLMQLAGTTKETHDQAPKRQKNLERAGR
ncbi:MAG: HTTM domain-containing protein [Pirellulales bacterium]|nr:HTTM domain-containing protein [Pirellulales bacterium]